MISVYLVIYLSLASLQKAPIVVAPMQDMDSCLIQAEKINKTDAMNLKSNPEAVALGAEVACIKVVRDLV